MSSGKSIFLRGNFYLQIVVWVALFMMPLTFVRPDQKLDIGTCLLLAVQPASLLVVFYYNYLYLFKKFFAGEKRLFWVANIAMVVGLALISHEAMTAVWRADHKKEMKEVVEKRHKKPEKPFASFNMLVILREMFNLTVSVGVAGSIVMGRRLIEAEQERQEAVNAKVEAELSNLRSQINPHFLLNTLNNIYALTAFDKNKAQTAIMELSKLLRHILYDNQQPFVPLTDEVVFLHNYISLMKIRLTSRVEVTEDIQVPDDCKAKVAPMIFISLVENAFKHGISPTEYSFIRIHISAAEGKIVCSIENSSHPKDNGDRSGHGIGLKQVERRLELIYPGRYEWLRGKEDNSNVYSSKLIIYDS